MNQINNILQKKLSLFCNDFIFSSLNIPVKAIYRIHTPFILYVIFGFVVPACVCVRERERFHKFVLQVQVRQPKCDSCNSNQHAQGHPKCLHMIKDANSVFNRKEKSKRPYNVYKLREKKQRREGLTVSLGLLCIKTLDAHKSFIQSKSSSEVIVTATVLTA